MNKYDRFKRITEAIIDVADIIKENEMPVYEQAQIKDAIIAFCYDEYLTVSNTLFTTPLPSYGYGYNPSQNSWNRYMPHYSPFSGWTPDSPVRPVTAGTKLDEMINGIQDETATIADATKFVNAIKQFLPKGRLNKQFGVMGEIINAVRDKEFEKAVQIVKDNWIEGEEEDLQVPPKNDGMYVPNIIPNDTAETWDKIFGGNKSSEEEPVEDDITD